MGEIKLMANVNNWMMVRRKGCSPFILHALAWIKIPTTPEKGKDYDLNKARQRAILRKDSHDRL